MDDHAAVFGKRVQPTRTMAERVRETDSDDEAAQADAFEHASSVPVLFPCAL